MAERLKISRIKFRAGSAPDASGLDIQTPNVTVFVGPNNSGKSQALRELETWCQGRDSTMVVIGGIELDMPDTADDLLAMLEPHKTRPPQNQENQVGHIWILRPVIRQNEGLFRQKINVETLRGCIEDGNLAYLRTVFVRVFTLRLDGKTRFDLVDMKERGDLIEEHPQNHLWALFTNDDAREKVRQFTKEAFEKHFVIDPTKGAELRVRLSDRAPHNSHEEQGLDATSRAFHREAALISDLGDGVQTSVGLVSAVSSLAQRILLIDEPEAFLHPTLARRVGRTLATTARDREASLVTATHSAEFLYGCIQADPDLRIVRLTYDAHGATARSIETVEIVKLMHDPLLRSANALRALFHRGVVVTEADADRAFYDEINHRLLSVDRGIEDGLFMNAQNWQTIPRIVGPLRRLGIPAAAVFDFDVLMGPDFQRVWPLLHADTGFLRALQVERSEIRDLMEAKGREACKKSGIDAIDNEDKQRITQFLAKMAGFGIFFVPVGELECWLAELDGSPSTNKSVWITNIFTALGSDPTAGSYVSAGTADAWEFIEKIEAWIADPSRLGIPTN